VSEADDETMGTISVSTLLAWLGGLPMAKAIRTTDWMFPAIETVHVVAISLVFGLALAMDLRLLNLTHRKLSAVRLVSGLSPAAMIAFVVAAVSGALMFLADSEDYYHNTYFRIKVCLIVLAGVNMAVFHWVTCRDMSTWPARGSLPLKARWAGGISCAIWTLVVFLGRWVGFTVQG
jgi:hypothetical protein